MIIPAYFHEAGVPKTGLSPTIDIYKVSDNSLVVNDGALTAVGGGFYKYDFAAYDSAEDYVYVVDGTATLANGYRYLFGGTDSQAKDALILNNLDHFMKTAVANEADMTTEVADNTVLSLIMTQEGDTSTYFPSGCSLVGLNIIYNLILDNVGGVGGDNGAGLTAIPWNAAWDTEVQSEVQDALEVNNLDHLIKVAKDTDWGTTVTKESIIDLMTSKDSSQTFSRSTEALEALRDRGDLAWLTGAGQAADTVTAPSSVTKIVGGTLSGNHTNLTAIDGSYCSLVETTTGTFLELNVAFAAPAGNAVATLRVWGYYAGGGGHFIRVQALDQVGGSVYEDVGTIPIAASVQAYSFNLAPEHIKADGTVTIKFIHSASVSGIGSHVLYLDKVQVSSITPVTEVDANLIKILDTVLTETSGGYLAAALKKFLDVATPVFTAASVNQSGDVFALDLPTNTELEARTIPAANYLVEGDTLARVTLVDTCTTNTDMRGTNAAALASVCTETRLAELDAANIPADIDGIKSKTTNLPSDPADQSAVEAAITAATSPLATAVAVADLPTNSELTTALAAADDAVLAAIAALNNLSSSGAQAAAAAALSAYGAALQTSVDDLESRLTAARAGYLDNLSGGAIATAAAVAALPTTAQINAEVVDALNVDTYAEPGQGAPPATASLATKIGYLFKSWLNKKDQDATNWKLYNNAGTVTDQKATVSEADGVVTKGKIGTGA